MAKVTVTKDRYTTDSLYQWDLNQVLEITGLSLPSIPEIHFVNDTMDRAIVRQASVDAAGVVRVYVPNALLQNPYKIKAYVCFYEGDSFKSEYLIEIPVVARPKPNDYTFEDDAGEIYSFNALENYVNDTVATLKADWIGYVNQCETAVATCNQAVVDCKVQTDNAIADNKREIEAILEENNAAFDEVVKSVVDHNHEPFHAVFTGTMSEEEFDTMLSEQFDQMDFYSSRRIFVRAVEKINPLHTGGCCFITLRKGGDWSYFTDLKSPYTAIAQIVANIGGNVFLCEKSRSVYDSTWSEFIWQNPRLIPGEEYATSECFDNKRVYTTVINFGSLPDIGIKGHSFLQSINHGLIIRVTGFTNDYKTIPYSLDGKSISLCVDGDTINVITNYDASASKGYVQVWYVKSNS